MILNLFKLNPLATEVKQLSRECLALREENLQLQRKLEELSAGATLAYRDVLTGLHNRRYFDERIVEEINRAKRDSGYVFSILMIDVNDFKQINDVHGHKTGDRALEWVARFLEKTLRQEDICSRLGGDEFVVILPGIDEVQCGQLVLRLRKSLHSAPQDLPVRIGLSVGIASYNRDGVSVETLFEHADSEMYQDKQAQKRLSQTKKFLSIPLAKQNTASYSLFTHKWALGS